MFDAVSSISQPFNAGLLWIWNSSSINNALSIIFEKIHSVQFFKEYQRARDFVRKIEVEMGQFYEIYKLIINTRCIYISMARSYAWIYKEVFPFLIRLVQKRDTYS